jgi:hypothetical protein
MRQVASQQMANDSDCYIIIIQYIYCYIRRAKQGRELQISGRLLASGANHLLLELFQIGEAAGCGVPRDCMHIFDVSMLVFLLT